MVLEYVTDRLVESVADEIAGGQPVALVEQPLMKAQAKDYVRQTQERLIGAPILQRLLNARFAEFGAVQWGTSERGAADQWLLRLLENWRANPQLEQGYGPGNVVNLLRLQRADLRGLDLSQLLIRQAYLAEIDAQDASVAGAQLADSVLAEAFHFPPCIALSGDGSLLAAGTSTGEVWVWRVSDRTPVWVAPAHSAGVWGIALSGDGRLLATGGGDGMVRLWAADSGRPLGACQGHTGTVWSVALSDESLQRYRRSTSRTSSSVAFGTLPCRVTVEARAGEADPMLNRTGMAGRAARPPRTLRRLRVTQSARSASACCRLPLMMFTHVPL